MIFWKYISRIIIYISFVLPFLFSMLPTQLSFDTNEINNIYRNDTHNIELGLPSNQIVDIELGNNKLFFGTSGGLGYLDLDGSYFSVLCNGFITVWKQSMCCYETIR